MAYFTIGNDWTFYNGGCFYEGIWNLEFKRKRKKRLSKVLYKNPAIQYSFNSYPHQHPGAFLVPHDDPAGNSEILPAKIHRP